jgi:HEAT repeat protein
MKNETRFLALLTMFASFSISALGRQTRFSKGGHLVPLLAAAVPFADQSSAGARSAGADSPDQAETLYRDAMHALDSQQWPTAVKDFSQLAGLHGKRCDEALYWEAYAQNKQGQRANALATIGQLENSYPRSHWLDDARALALQLRQASGQSVSPERQPDDQLKLLAINGLMNSDPDQAIPLLAKLIASNQPVTLKERALFVLTQSGSPKARQAVDDIARSNPDPVLRSKALDDLALFGGEQSRKLLAEIYASSNDVQVKQHILHDFMISGDRQQLLDVAKTDKSHKLREAAIIQLGLAGGQAQLGQLYQQETNEDVKKAILRGMFLGGNQERLYEAARSDRDPELRREAIHDLGLMGAKNDLEQLYRQASANYHQESALYIKKEILHSMFLEHDSQTLLEVARTETNPELRLEAIHSLGLIQDPQTSEALVSLYASNHDQATRKAIVEALFIQGNAHALVELARKENDPEMKKAIVGRLSLMHSKEATRYMLEILNH